MMELFFALATSLENKLLKPLRMSTVNISVQYNFLSRQTARAHFLPPFERKIKDLSDNPGALKTGDMSFH